MSGKKDALGASGDRCLVYSTDGSFPLPTSDRPKPKRQTGVAQPPDDGVVRVGCEKRRGGVVTLIYGLLAAELAPVATELRRTCGTGGTAKDGVVALQGDKRDAVLAYFAARGRRTKRMGG
jgi:translation initiation factor 1